MPKRNRNLARLFVSLAALAGLSVFLRRRPETNDVRPPMLEPVTDPVPVFAPAPRPRPAARLALVSGFTLLFFAGASFTAGAGDRVAAMLEGDGVGTDQVGAVAAGVEVAVAPAPVSEPAPVAVAEPAAAPAPAPQPAAAQPAAAPATEPAAEPVATPVHVDAVEAAPTAAQSETQSTVLAATPSDVKAAAAPVSTAPVATKRRVAPKARPLVAPRAQLAPPRPAEIEHGDAGAATVWLNRALPDPTPPSARLTRSFAQSLARTARLQKVDWATVLGVLRAQGELGSAPATRAELSDLVGRLGGRDAWRGALTLTGRTTSDRAVALADFYRAVGMESLVTGLEASKDRLVTRVLDDERLTLYSGGREDIAAGRVDVRVVVLLAYLVERHGSVTVSSLFSGHRKFARAGVVSAHVYGHAVDIAAVGGLAILGNQQPGGITESVVNSILLLPAEVQPQQVISLLGLGGPSFPLADHGDHVHVGY